MQNYYDIVKSWLWSDR